MTQEKILENNKLIAGFDNVTIGKDKVFKYERNGSQWAAEGLKYHSSWDWLMPVVEKIEKMSIGEYVIIESLVCYMKAWRGMGYAEELNQRGMTKIEAVYLFVVEYIKKQDREKGEADEQRKRINANKRDMRLGRV